MRTWLVVAVAAVVTLVAFAVPTHSQEPIRVGAVIDITALANKLDAATKVAEDLKKQNEELKKAVLDGNKTLDMIAAGVGILRVPIKWEYQFVRARSEQIATKLGREGWELVAIWQEKEFFVFRRPLPPGAEPAGGEAPPAAP